MYKIRTISYNRAKEPVTGITIPNEVSKFFSGCYFKVEIKTINGSYGMFFTSGCFINPTKQEVEKYDFSEDRL